MTFLLSIDPGVRGVGAALFRGALLVGAGYVKNSAREGVGPGECAAVAVEVVAWVRRLKGDSCVDQLVLEWPQMYSGRAARGDGSSLLSLAAVDGAIAASFRAPTRHVVPHGWKGNVPKPDGAKSEYIIRSRVMDRLSEDERRHVVWPESAKFGWDVADAIGVGLWALGRFERKRGNL